MIVPALGEQRASRRRLSQIIWMTETVTARVRGDASTGDEPRPVCEREEVLLSCRGLAERANGLVFAVVNVEHGQQFRYLEEIAHALREIG